MAVRLPPSLTPTRLPESKAPDAGHLYPRSAGSGGTDRIALWGLARKAGARILQETLPWITRDRRAREALSEAITDRMISGGLRNELRRFAAEGPLTRDTLKSAVSARLLELSRSGMTRHSPDLGKPVGTVMSTSAFRRHFDDALGTAIENAGYLDGSDGAAMRQRLQAAVEVAGAAERAFLDVLEEWSTRLGSTSLGLGAGAGIGATLTHLLRHLRGKD